MKVVMLGHSGVGKTTYMASMYGEMQTPVNELGLRAERRADHDQLLLMHASLASGRYPSPSDQRAEYDFVLTYEGEDFFPFTWLDYRGGALGEHRGSEQTRQLVEDLKEADGILVFCDSELLARGPGAARPIGRITALVTQALASFERPVPLGIVLTKADLVDELDDEKVAPIRGLADAIAASERVLGTVIPVACGRQPMDVQAPVLFILHFGIMYLASSMVEAINEHVARKESFEQRSGFWDEIVSAFKGEPTWSRLAEVELAQAREIAEKLDILEAPVKALKAYLKDLPIF